MRMKKLLAATAVCALLVGILAVPASAHGGHHGRRRAATYPVCTVADCTRDYRHDHDGTTYCAHSATDGHSWCADTAATTHHGRCH